MTLAFVGAGRNWARAAQNKALPESDVRLASSRRREREVGVVVG